MQVRYNGGMARIDRIRRVIQVAMVILAALLFILIFFLVRQSMILRREQVLSARELWISNLLKRRGPPTQSDVVFVQAWMTFDYVNQLFGIPPDYLQHQLSISDPGYPHITISGYARHYNLNVAAFLADIDRALVGYLTPATSTRPGA